MSSQMVRSKACCPCGCNRAVTYQEKGQRWWGLLLQEMTQLQGLYSCFYHLPLVSGRVALGKPDGTSHLGRPRLQPEPFPSLRLQ